MAAVYEMGGHYAVCAGPDFYEGRCLILATGVAARGQIPGENRLLGKGVSCCATCDGELYRGRNIAVVCESQSLEEDVRFLQSVAGHVELFCTYAGGLADTPGCHKGRPQTIEGDDRVTGVRWADATLPVEGVFCLRETVAPQALLSGLAMENGHIQVDRAQRTNLPGCFAAGDCTGRPYQYAKAVGEGNVAVHSALAFPGWLGYLGRLAGVLAGNALLAYGVAAVYLPAGLAVGGATGVGLILHTLFGLDTAVSVFVLNLGLLVAGWACIGREFAINTAAGSLAYPVFLGLCQRLPAFSLLETDRFAALVCGACFVGAGVGVTLRAGASTGGSDSLAMILHRSGGQNGR